VAELSVTISESEGVVVFSAEKDAEVGLLPGDILLKINGKKISSVSDVQTALQKQLPVWRFTIKRGDQTYKFNVQR
jgi:S1-C subfamily serine protease